MKVAIHQPNYLPWLGFFYKIHRCDCFVVLDDAQYTKNSFINRNHVKGPNGAIWLTVPVKTSGTFGSRILDMEISGDTDWNQKHLLTIDQAYRKAPQFGAVFPAIESILAQPHANLCALNIELLQLILGRAGLTKRIVRSSELHIESTGTRRLADICAVVDGRTYISGSGGSKYQDEEVFESAGLKLEYSDYGEREYAQMWGAFIGKLSALDYIFNHGWDLQGYFNALTH